MPSPTPLPAPEDISRDDLPGTPLAERDTTNLTDVDHAVAGAAANAAAARRGATDEDNCFWEKTAGPNCVGGQLREYWCFICCSGLHCETVSCEWRIVGVC